MTLFLDRVVCTDALTLLKSQPTESVDLIFTDPPYNLGYRYQAHDDTMTQADYLDWCHDWLTECVRVLKPTGSLFLLHIPHTAMLLGAWLDSRLIFQHWITWKAASRASNKPLMPEHYALLYYTKSEHFTTNEVRAKHKRCRKCGELVADYGGKKHLAHAYGPQISDVWTDIGRLKAKQRGEHPCALPEKLVRRVILFASNVGDVVLDPFVGTGTTAYVAMHERRHFIAGDNSAAYVEMANKRLAESTIPLPM